MLTPGLDRNTEMQRQPLGTFSALRRPSPVASQYKRQSEMYGQALRTLSRAARRGDAGAAIKAIGLRDMANENGFAPGGIRRSESVQGDIAGREQRMGQETELAQKEDQFYRSQLDRRMGMSRDPQPPQTPTAPQSEPMGPPASAANTRTSAALDMLEGRMGGDGTGPEADQFMRGREAAASLGVQDPDSLLSGDRTLKYRRTLDSALGQAKTPAEIAALRERGTKNGISSKAFDRRAKWWDSNR